MKKAQITPLCLFRAVLRLILLRITSQRTVLQPSIPERSTDPTLLAATEGKLTSGDNTTDTWKASRTGLTIPTISSLRAEGASGMRSVEAEISAFLQTKVLTIDNVRKPYDLVRQRKGFGALAEVVWILRPLVYGKLAWSGLRKRHNRCREDRH